MEVDLEGTTQFSEDVGTPQAKVEVKQEYPPL